MDLLINNDSGLIWCELNRCKAQPFKKNWAKMDFIQGKKISNDQELIQSDPVWCCMLSSVKFTSGTSFTRIRTPIFSFACFGAIRV